MRKRWIQGMGILLSTVMLAQTFCEPVMAANVEEAQTHVMEENSDVAGAEYPDFASEGTGVTVTNADELLAALEKNESLITVEGAITIGDEADATGKMYPVEIPGGTVIQGVADASISCRCPIQLAGDNVMIKNIQLTFESSNALGSVPHREIFLAGHSLTLDNVKTYLAGADGTLGGFGGSEEELLPTVYAGGFENTTVSNKAALTIQNGNDKTMFQGIYMSHDAGTDSKVSYTGNATISICPKTIVRDGIHTETNTSATIQITGEGNVSNVAFYGNSETTLTVKQSNVYGTTLDNVGSLILDEGGYFALKEGSLGNVVLQKGACLDLNGMTDVVVMGDFQGGAYDVNAQEPIDERGVLVLDEEGSLEIQGAVSETTIFHTDNRNFPGTYISEKQYIIAASNSDQKLGFCLPDSKTEAYELLYENGGWIVYESYIWDDYPTVESIGILSAPTAVDISKIKGKNFIPSKEAPSCNVIWKDEEGEVIDFTTVEELMLYAPDTIIGIKTAYWLDADSGDKTDWGNVVQFVTAEDTPNEYYFYVDESNQADTGDYTFLFCSEWSENLNTVADVKALKGEGKIKAELRVLLYDLTTETQPEKLDIVSVSLNDITADGSTKTTEIVSVSANNGIIYPAFGTAQLPDTVAGTYNEAKIISWSLDDEWANYYQLPDAPQSIAVLPEVKILAAIPDPNPTPEPDPTPDKTPEAGNKSDTATTHTHSYTVQGAREATCNKAGYTGDIYCKECGQKIASGTVIEKSSTHAWDAGIVTKEPTAVAEGERTYTCTICGTIKTECIQMTEAPSKGEILTDNKTKAKYVITISGKKGGTVEYMQSTSKNAKAITIPPTTTIDGITYKVTSIAPKTFKNNKKLTKVIIGSNVITLGKEAFYGCKKLKTVTIGKNVKNIRKKAFYNCNNLKSITIKTTKLTKKTVGSKAFSKTNKKVTVKVPAKKWKAYKSLLKEKGISGKAKIKK